jgi:hypothetical protein
MREEGGDRRKKEIEGRGRRRGHEDEPEGEE